ncbi:MAG: cation:proton antiporter [Coraliomargarita sp.]
MYQTIALLSLFILIYSSVSRRLELTPVSGAVVYTVFGLLCGPACLGWLKLNVEAEALSLIAELTLAVVLFSDAASVNLKVLRQNIGLPLRLLLVGLPLTIGLGFLSGQLLLGGMGVWSVAILSTMLAPTDAALGKAVVTDESVPKRIRESLNVESGLNDGICVPILFVFLALVTSAQGSANTASLAFGLVAKEIGIGLVCGVGITNVANHLLRIAAEVDWISETWGQWSVVALSTTCFAVAQYFGASGFIAAFCGGLLYGAMARGNKHASLLESECTGDLLSLITWVVFGACYVGQGFAFITVEVVLFALLSLTVVRMLPVFVCLSGTGLSVGEKLFAGWFGPRGLASIVFAVIVLGAELPANDTLVACVICTVTLSILGHGLSANPLIKLLATKKP